MTQQRVDIGSRKNVACRQKNAFCVVPNLSRQRSFGESTVSEWSTKNGIHALFEHDTVFVVPSLGSAASMECCFIYIFCLKLKASCQHKKSSRKSSYKFPSRSVSVNPQRCLSLLDFHNNWFAAFFVMLLLSLSHSLTLAMAACC